MDAKNVQIEITPLRSPTNSCLFSFIPYSFTSETSLTAVNIVFDTATSKLFAANRYILPEKDELINVKGELIGVTGEPVGTKSYLLESKRYPVNISRYPVESKRCPVNLSRYPVESKRCPVNLSRYPVDSSRCPVDSLRYPFNYTSLHYALSWALFREHSLKIAHLLNFLIIKVQLYIYFYRTILFN